MINHHVGCRLLPRSLRFAMARSCDAGHRVDRGSKKPKTRSGRHAGAQWIVRTISQTIPQPINWYSGGPLAIPEFSCGWPFCSAPGLSYLQCRPDCYRFSPGGCDEPLSPISGSTEEKITQPGLRALDTEHDVLHVLSCSRVARPVSHDGRLWACK